MLGRAGVDLQLLGEPLGPHAAHGALDGDGRVARPPELLPGQPAAHVLLDHHGLVVQEELERTGRGGRRRERYEE